MNKGWRIGLLFVSPLFLLCYLLLGIFLFFEYLKYDRKYGFLDEERIERITEVRLPDFELVEYQEGEMNFRGEYSDKLIIEFEETLSDEFYTTLDSLVKRKVWSKDEKSYYFHTTWGNGLPAPEGENEEADIMFNLTIERGTNRAVIGVATW